MDGDRENPERLTVSVVAGIIVHKDGISAVARQQALALADFGARRGTPIDLKVFTLAAQWDDPRVAVVADAAAVAADEHFLRSDLIVYHFGVYYPLFDSIHMTPPTARVVVNFYGITPPALLGPQHSAGILRSYRQALLLHAADRVVTTSQFLVRGLLDMGVPADRVLSLPLPLTLDAPPPRPDPEPDSLPRFVYLGRLVPSKGVLDLLQAYLAFSRQAGSACPLDLAGSRNFSDGNYLKTLRDFVLEHHLDGTVRFLFDASAAQVRRTLAGADVLVIPSYHEGFCLPVIEALACGCFVICSDAGALPETAGGLGRTYPVGRVDRLAAVLAECVAARRGGGVVTDGTGFLPFAEWRRRVAAYLRDFAPEHCDRGYCEAVLAGVPGRPFEARTALRQAYRGQVARLRDTPPQACAKAFDVGRCLADLDGRVSA